jgi:hypothetical protein
MYLPEVRNYGKQKPCSSLKTMAEVSFKSDNKNKKRFLDNKNQKHTSD